MARGHVRSLPRSGTFAYAKRFEKTLSGAGATVVSKSGGGGGDKTVAPKYLENIPPPTSPSPTTTSHATVSHPINRE